MNESETLIRSFTIILAVHQLYSILLHVTYVCIMELTNKPRKGLKPCLTFYPTYDWELAFHIYIYREREREFTGDCIVSDLTRFGIKFKEIT